MPRKARMHTNRNSIHSWSFVTFVAKSFFLFGVLASWHSVTLRRTPPARRHGMVATVQPVATDAGVNAMRDGGNAVDAAISSALMLGVLDGHNSGIGGGCFILLRTSDGKFVAIDGREMAPAAANARHVHPQRARGHEPVANRPVGVGSSRRAGRLCLCHRAFRKAQAQRRAKSRGRCGREGFCAGYDLRPQALCHGCRSQKIRGLAKASVPRRWPSFHCR